MGTEWGVGVLVLGALGLLLLLGKVFASVNLSAGVK